MSIHLEVLRKQIAGSHSGFDGTGLGICILKILQGAGWCSRAAGTTFWESAAAGERTHLPHSSVELYI